MSDQVVDLKDIMSGPDNENEKSSTTEEEVESSKSEDSETKATHRKKKAQKAFQEKNVEASIDVHNTTTVAKEKHKKGGDFIKSIIYGGLDGIMTAFTVVTASAGAVLGSRVIIILGIATLIADGIGMGISDFISGKAEIDYARSEKKREEWEYDNFPKGEIDEMIQLYQDKGMKEEDARLLVEALTKHKQTFIETMMVEELGVMAPDSDDNPAIDGLITFASFVIYGILPLIPFMIGAAVDTSFIVLFGISCALVAVVMFGLGAFSSLFTILTWYRAGLQLLVVGVIGAIASYLIGWGMGYAVATPVEPPFVCNCTGA